MTEPEPKMPELVVEPPVKLVVDAVSKRFHTEDGEVEALGPVSFNVKEGEVLCLVGPSGCGKSTMLNIIAGLEHADMGKVLADGNLVTAPGPDRMMMFQEHALFPWLPVLGNVLFGLKLKRKLNAKERLEVAQFYLKLVGLEKFEKTYVHELSGGMRQRVSLARALAPNPRVLLMDEPFAALDALTREQLYGDLQQIFEQRRKTVVFVTHNVREAACLGDRVLLFSPQPGRIHDEFKIDLPRPREINNVRLTETASRITHALKAYTNLTTGWRCRMRSWVTAVIFFLALVAAWQWLVSIGVISHMLLPTPLEVGQYFVGAARDGTLWAAILVTLKRLALGYFCGTVVGVPLGFVNARFRVCHDSLGLLALGFQALPSICWAPLAMLWFGQSEWSIFFIVVMGTIWSVALATEGAVRHMPPIYLRAAKTMGSKKLHLWVNVIAPASLPSILGGMKQGWAFAWRSLMAAEIYIAVMAIPGLGSLLHFGRELHAMDQVFAIIIVVVVIGLIADKILFGPAERFLHKRWGTDR